MPLDSKPRLINVKVMVKRKHIPVRYLDRLNRLCNQLRILAYVIEDYDDEAFPLMQELDERLGSVLMMLNREGPEREVNMRRATGERPQ